MPTGLYSAVSMVMGAHLWEHKAVYAFRPLQRSVYGDGGPFMGTQGCVCLQASTAQCLW
jgi:hypothetical protein